MPATGAKHATESSVKIAIDFPAPLFRETAQAAQELSTTRSSVVRTAVEMFLRSRRREKIERQIAESFSENAESDRRLMDEFQHVDADSDMNL